MTVRRFEDLGAWKKARELTNFVYSVTKRNSFRSDWALRNQIREAAVSTMSNIAEGFARNSDREFRQFLFIAKASTAELQSHGYVALDQQYLLHAEFEKFYEMTDHLSRMLSNLIKYLKP